MQTWEANGRDPSPIVNAMHEKVGPLLDAGKLTEAEPELDHVLEQLKQDGKSAPASAPQANRDIPDEVRSKLTHNVGSSFLVFRGKVQEELKATPEQKEKLDRYLRGILPDAMQVLRQGKDEREKYNQKLHEEMAAVLSGILKDGQRTRLHQLELQRDGLFGAGWNLKELQITDEQHQQFMAPTQETDKKIKALMEQVRQGANPNEIRPRVLKLRLELEGQLEALLTDDQKKRWKDMLGEPVDLSVLFDGVSSR